jgi:hypothetical protein
MSGAISARICDDEVPGIANGDNHCRDTRETNSLYRSRAGGGDADMFEAGGSAR